MAFEGNDNALLRTLAGQGGWPWLLALACGIFLAPLVNVFPALPLVLLPVFALLCWWPSTRVTLAASLVFFALLGYGLTSLSLTPPRHVDHLLHAVDAQPWRVAGRVVELGSRPGGKGYLDMRVERIGRQGQSREAHGRLRLYWDEGEPPLRPGDEVRFRARLRRPYPFGTPGEFDYARFLAARDIWVTAYVRHADELAVFPQLGKMTGDRFARLRQQLREAIHQTLEADDSALLRALLIGDKGAMEPAQREVLARAGVAHLFSISGLHLGLVAGYGYFLLQLPWRRSEWLLLRAPPRRWLPLLLIPLLWSYLLLTGAAVPTRRAFLMTSLAALLWPLCRCVRPLHVVAVVALVFLLVEPLLLFEASFQLSFAGVIAIMALVPRWRHLLAGWHPLLRWAGLLLLTTTAAWLGTLPWTLLHFHLLPTAALPANLLAVPVVSLLILPLGLIALALMPLWPAVAEILLRLDAQLLSSLLGGIEWLTRQPLMGGYRLYPTHGQLAALSAGVVLVLLPGLSGCRKHLRHCGICLCLLLALWTPSVTGALRLTALSVGQGEALLLTLPDGRHLLVDGGGLHSATFDVGERLVSPALGRLGVRSLAVMALTHDHHDHRDGLRHVLQHYPVAQFWSGTPPEDLSDPLASLISGRAVEIQHFPPGWHVLEEEGDWQLAVYQPEPRGAALNDQSLVIYARLGADGLLLTGDLEAAGVSKILTDPPPGPVTLLKLPHHGGAGCRSEELCALLKPRLAIASLGRDNRHGMPAASVVAALEEQGTALWRTDVHGTLRMESRGQGWRVNHWSQGRFR